MVKGKGRKKVDRQAVAKANGYVRGENRQKDQVRDENKYSDDSIALQDRVLEDYRKWVSDDDEENQDECLQEGQPAPDLATVKDFIRFYIFSTHGTLTVRPTMSSVKNYAERFFAGFTRVTKQSFVWKDTQDVYHWISKSLVKEDVIENKKRSKHMFTHCDLTNILVSIWTDDDPFFIHERNRIQITFALLLYCYSGARIGTFIPDSSKAEERGLRYEDIELYIYRRSDGEKEIFFRLSEKWVKNNYDPKNTVFRIAMREHGKLRFNPVPYLLTLAFADGAFFHLNSPEELERWDPEEPTRLLWKSDMENKPILRMVTRSSGVSERALVRQTFCRLFRAIVCNAGYYEIITIHSLRRGLANRIDKVATEAEKGQILNQQDPNVFGRSYIDNTSALSSIDAFLGEQMRLDHIEYLRGVGKYREKGYPRRLPAEIERGIQDDPTLQGLQNHMKNLSLEKECDLFELGMSKKQEQALRHRLHDDALKKYRDDWMRNRLEGKILSGGKSLPNAVVHSDIAHCLFKVLPERQRLARMIPSDKTLSHQEMLSTVNDLLSLCTRSYDVYYYPGEEPSDGKCPIGNCQYVLEKLPRPRRSNHVHNCRHQEICNTLSCKLDELKYCYECFEFVNLTQWEDHCAMHLTHTSSRRCEVILYCYTLVRPGYCPLCLGAESLRPSERMSSWKRSNDLRAHVDGHLKRMTRTTKAYTCTHPMCQEGFSNEMGLRYHLSDVHGLQKAIWAMDEKDIDVSEEDLETQLEAYAEARGKKRKLNKAEENSTETRRQKIERCSVRSSRPHAEVEDLQIIPWQPSIPSTPPIETNKNTCNNAKDLNCNTICVHDNWTASKDEGVDISNSASSTPSLTLSQATNPSEVSLDKIDPQLLDYDQGIKAMIGGT